MILQRQRGRKQKRGGGGRTLPLIITLAPPFEHESQSTIERKRRIIVFGHVEKERFRAAPICFVRSAEDERARVTPSPCMRQRRERENFGFVSHSLNQDQGLQLSLSRIVGNECESGALHQAAKGRRVPGLVETLAMDACKRGCIGTGRQADGRAQSTAPGSFASGARK